jgi:hypothetical protein
MKAQILTATLFTALSGALSAADQQLLSLMMPDAKVLAGVNVDQAKGTLFGQFVLNQLQTNDAEMQKLIDLTGFDPRRDVHELLVASDGKPQSKTGLVAAKGSFDIPKISALAAQHGVVTELYNGYTILEDPKSQEHGIAFLDASTVVAGDLASVKGAIDRQKSPQPLPADVIVNVNYWSSSEDAWGITTVPPTSLAPAGQHQGQSPVQGAVQYVQQAAGGVKFGAQVVFTGTATCDTAQNATTLSDMIKLLINIAQMQTGTDPTAAELVKSVTVTTSGNVVQTKASLSEETFQQIVQSSKKQMAPRGPARLPEHRQAR